MAGHDALLKDLGLDVELHGRIIDSIGRNFRKTVLGQTNRPARMAYFDGVINGAHGERVREIVDRRAAGDKFIGTFCIYVPEELILALGAIPMALCGGTSVSIPYAEKTFPRDICPLVKSTLGLTLSNTCPYGPIEDLAVGETTCDAKKKTWDILSKGGDFHVLEVPQKKGPRDRELWHEEVVQFKSRLEELSGRRLEPEKLAQAVRLMNRKRRALARLNAFRKETNPPVSGLDALVVMQGALLDDTLRFTEKLEALNDELGDRVRRGVGVASGRIKRIMVSGCPSVMGNWKLHHVIESAGALVVCDETCTGSRYYENPVEETDGGLDAQVAAIAARYLKIDCSCFSPNDERLDSIVRLARECRVDGVIQYVLQYCHTYNIEAVRVASALKEAGVPSLKIVTDYSEEDMGQLRIRVDAFLEGLER
ncbi:MAG: double-cubane-cluster-containing anaerobic reductase [Candidatus Aminicenantes bacterium]|nr:double-cubane-cluster-containing anaerobic reductase [Candidatus Aminicenantes bacterium]